MQKSKSLSIVRKWSPPENGKLKLNVDASWYAAVESFSIGMVHRDGGGNFIEGRVFSFPQVESVLEAESVGVKEALSWVMSREERKVIVELDSKLATDVINGQQEYVLEVGHVIDLCKMMLHLLPEVSVNHIRK